MSQLALFDQLPPTHTSPILKWAGGKSSLLSQFKRYFPPHKSFNRYFEPFVGGGAVFFYLRPNTSYLFDLNHELIEVYQLVRDQVDDLIEALQQHHNDETHFYQVRSLNPSDLTPIERAARFIFLNKTCYNGLYRVNKQGQFNVPFGSYKKPNIVNAAGLKAASVALSGAHLEIGDFERVVEYAQQGDLIYFDPPYDPLSTTSNFTNYTSVGFSSDDQRRLARVFNDLHQRGCLLMLSNSDTPLIREIYGSYHLNQISARRAINSDPNGRGKIPELLITNFVQSQSSS